MRMTKKKIINLVAIALALVAVVVLSIVLKTDATVDCPDCEGRGYIAEIATCPVCEGEEGAVETCETCGQTGEIKAAVVTECETCEGKGSVTPDSRYYATFMALVPPILAIMLALITKEVYSSLFVGVVAGGIFYANFNPVTAVEAITTSGIIDAVAGTAGIFAFLVILGAIVILMNKAGGSAAFGKWAQTHVKTRVGALLATFALGVLIFVDDYFNCLTVGSVMQPVTDRHKISRVKLAYLIDATAAPICMIAPVSSWAAAVSEYVAEGEGLKYFIKAIPYNFYSLLTIAFVITITIMGYDYGKMANFEFKAQNEGDLGAKTDAEEAGEATASRARVFDLIVPIVVLIVSCVVALLYVGGFFTAGDTQWNMIQAFGDTDATVGLPIGSLVALVITVVYLMCRRLINFKESMSAIPNGFIAMVPAILILTLATALKNMTSLLGSDDFVAGVLENAGALKLFLPAIIFLIACALSFATGTSWGTFGILIPIVQAGVGLGTELGVIAMSACLAGSVCGDHCSPISDTTIMASAGAQCNHVDHVATQLPYALTVAAVSFVSYVIAGVLQNVGIYWYVTLPIALVLMIGTLFGIRVLKGKKQAL